MCFSNKLGDATGDRDGVLRIDGCRCVWGGLGILGCLSGAEFWIADGRVGC
jgi:hypothetical protein